MSADRGLEPDAVAARKRRNLVLGLSLAGFLVLIYLVTLARIGANILERPL